MQSQSVKTGVAVAGHEKLLIRVRMGYISTEFQLAKN
jgi:hypothetical protein